MGSLFWALIGMIVSFIGIYLFVSKKIDQTEISDQLNHHKKVSGKFQLAKQGLVILRRKHNILKLYQSLSEKDREEVLSKLQELK